MFAIGMRTFVVECINKSKECDYYFSEHGIPIEFLMVNGKKRIVLFLMLISIGDWRWWMLDCVDKFQFCNNFTWNFDFAKQRLHNLLDLIVPCNLKIEISCKWLSLVSDRYFKYHFTIVIHRDGILMAITFDVFR